MATKILLIEDETAIRDMVTYALGRDFHIHSVEDTKSATQLIMTFLQ